MSVYMALQARNFAGSAEGKPTRLITLQNSRGMNVRFTTLGAKILQIVVPDRDAATSSGEESWANTSSGRAG